MAKLAVLTSGGDAPGMNAAIRSTVRAALHEGFEVCGVDRGYEGLIDGDIKDMNEYSVSDIMQRGGTKLQTARSERFRTPEGREKAYMVAQAFGIDALVVIGGDGSMRGALELSKLGMNVMCIPGTIDNDLGYTDFTIGFDTAVNTVLSAIGNIRDTSSSHERTTVIEVMGRRCGDIAIYSGICGGAEAILIPEMQYDINEICKSIIIRRNSGKLHNIIIKAEGVDMDIFEMAKLMQERTGMETKALSLSYLQRGGSPSARDRLLATEFGYKAVELIKKGSSNRAIGIAAGEVVHFDLEDALQMKKPFKKELYEMAEELV